MCDACEFGSPANCCGALASSNLFCNERGGFVGTESKGCCFHIAIFCRFADKVGFEGAAVGGEYADAIWLGFWVEGFTQVGNERFARSI
ncbi:MAG: hypothetical protein S4CHLAM102_11200 [Chlamydiia bacterium]|nr:hypothetical protein [Chlamydiia bacterium]